MLNKIIATDWNFQNIWKLVAAVLVSLLLLLWAIGFGPWRDSCKVPPTVVEKKVEVEKVVDNPKNLSRIAELEKGNAKIAGLMTTIEGLKTDNAQIADLTTKVKTLETDNTQLAELKNKIAELEDANKGMADLQKKLEALTADNAQIPDLKSKVVELEGSNKGMADLQKKLETLTADNAQIPDLKAKVVELEGSNKGMADLQKKLEMLTADNAQIPDLKAKVIELEGSNKGMADLQSQVKELDAANEKLSALQGQIKELETQAQLIPGLQEKISALQNAKPKVIEKIVEKIVNVPAAASVTAATKSFLMPKKGGATLPDIAKVIFEAGSAKSPADISKSLEGVASYMSSNTSATVWLSGFHDASGDPAANQALSLERSRSIASLLQEAGVSAIKIIIKKPAKSEGSAEEANRVEVKIEK